MQHIRPHKALALFETKTYYDRMVKVVLPDVRSPFALETVVLLAVAKHVQPRVFFEFGTYLGITTLNTAANLPEDTAIYTLDLDDPAFQKASQHPGDKKLSIDRFESDHQIAFLGTPFERRIKRLYGDSNLFDFSPFQGKVNMAYIDGGHDLRTVRSDTENAFRMLDMKQPGCVAWHDYRNPNYPELTRYLDELSGTRELVHVEETLTVFMLHKP